MEQVQPFDELVLSQRRDGRRVAGAVLTIAIPSAAGVLIALGAFLLWVFPAVGLGGLDRVRALGSHLDSPFTAPTAVCLGNSVAFEGIDAAAIAATAPSGWHVENLGMEGGDLTEQLVLLPRLLQARPRVVLFVLRPIDLSRCEELPLDKAHAYRLAGFVDAWPSDWWSGGVPGPEGEIAGALRASRFESTIHFRTAPLVLVNEWVRRRLSGDIREPAPADWTAPHKMLGSIDGARLERHLVAVMDTYRDRTRDGFGRGERQIREMVARIQDAGAVPVAALAPVHPRLRAGSEEGRVRLRALLAELQARHGALVVDAHDVLEEDSFADAVHPNERGRAAWSALLGRALPPP